MFIFYNHENIHHLAPRLLEYREDQVPLSRESPVLVPSLFW